MKRLINKLTGLFRRRRRIGQNRNIKRAKFLYWYIIIGGIGGLIYALVSVFISSWPTWMALTPVIVLILLFLSIQLRKTWKVIWMGISDVNRGRLLLYLNNNTHFSEPHKVRLVRWVYPHRNEIRMERRSELMEKVRQGEELQRIEKKQLKRTTVRCPQQLRDGINEAFLVAALIYSHINISLLDGELREIMNLTDDNINAFDLQVEIDRCRTKKSA